MIHELTKGILDVLTAAAAVAAAVAAWIGVWTWRAQLGGTAEHDTATRVLREVYRLQRLLNAARNAFSYAGEGADRERDNTEQLLEAQARDTAHAYGKRLQSALDARTELQVAELDAVALWGHSAEDVIRPLHVLTNQLTSAHWLFFGEMIRGTHGQRRMPADIYMKQEAIVWEGAAESDAYASELLKAVKDAETYFRRFIVSRRVGRSRRGRAKE